MAMSSSDETICAVATPAGKGGVSIIRISGPLSTELCSRVSGKNPRPREAVFAHLKDENGSLIDHGMVLFFKAPHSFTGEDVCELHTHGSPVITDLLLNSLVACGARLARPGEFSERAFLNDKIDLAQAEAIADLINSSSITAARFAVRSLQGEFSRLIYALVDSLTSLRIYIEAALDFPEEEVDFLAEGAIGSKLELLRQRLDDILKQARQGSLVREGIKVAIVGEPNAGKSTLLNALCGEDIAIVTDIAGTTRDILRQTLDLNGLPIHILDTAGLRASNDPVEQEGIKRAWGAIADADVVLLLMDSRQLSTLDKSQLWNQLIKNEEIRPRVLLVLNKIDLTQQAAEHCEVGGFPAIGISAKKQIGLELLRTKLKERAGFAISEEGGFLARRRHVVALSDARDHVVAAISQLTIASAGELVAEELKQAQDALGGITGKVTSDDLLGKIFSSFCIGK